MTKELAVIVALLAGGCSEGRELSSPCVDCVVRVHPPGILDQASPDFHGAELARRDWDFPLCATCHGEDFAGGKAKVACTTCHVDGPTQCTTCHGGGPTSGAHAAHGAAMVACAECHVVPQRWDDPGHILGDVAPAEITFGALAATTAIDGVRLGPPGFAAGTCTNVYCHGAALRAGGGTATQPRWDEPTPVATCDRCHGAPPPSHAQTMCTTCHPGDAPHVDGVLQIGRTGGCDGCHGSSLSPAPPTDLAGTTYTTALGVGAHQAHLIAPAGLRGPIACATCHVVPTSVAAVGHIDSALPAEVDLGLGWDRTTATCTTAWCHGAARPTWTEQGGAACGTCHGIPPIDVDHAANLTLTDCVTCHPDSVTAAGTILLVAGPGGVSSAHLNGVIDAR